MFPPLLPGESPAVITVGAARITKVAVDPQMNNNAYLIACTHGGTRLLIDAAAEPNTILSMIGSGGLTYVVTTHSHWDHHGALADVVAATGAAVIAGAADAAEIASSTGVNVDRTVVDGDTVTVGEVVLEVVTLVGHTPGSIALIYRPASAEPHVFTGDSLFPGGVGNTRGNKDAFASLLSDVRSKLFDVLPDETVFHPGHGDDSTIGAQRGSLREWERRGW